MTKLIAAVRRHRQARRARCRVDEEWCGLFIGRRWCATHAIRWDDGGPCPATRVPAGPSAAEQAADVLTDHRRTCRPCAKRGLTPDHAVAELAAADLLHRAGSRA